MGGGRSKIFVRFQKLPRAPDTGVNETSPNGQFRSAPSAVCVPPKGSSPLKSRFANLWNHIGRRSANSSLFTSLAGASTVALCSRSVLISPERKHRQSFRSRSVAVASATPRQAEIPRTRNAMRWAGIVSYNPRPTGPFSASIVSDETASATIRLPPIQ
jgi:hypothetical protein